MSNGDLEVLLASRVPLIVIESRDESRVLRLLRRACRRGSGTRPALGLPLFEWTISDGLRRADVEHASPQRTLSEPLDVLRSIRASNMACVYALVDFHPFLKEPLQVRLLKDICLEYDRCPRTIVLLSPEIDIPRELEDLSARCNLALPGAEEIRQIVGEIAAQWEADNPGQRTRTDPQALELFIANATGLSAAETERLARRAIFDDGALAASDIPAIMQAKYESLNRHGILRYEHGAAAWSDVGGLRHFKAWLEPRRSAFDGSAAGLDLPKGVLLLGVQGCGKSLAARAAAAAFGVPLLSLDCAALFDKFVGETERRLRESLASAELLAPCVLWIDEIEKGFATAEGDAGTSRRVMGSFLTWLAERRARVFIVATANDITGLPPELIRKGRFDEIFFVDLPDASIRAEIWSIHLKKRSVALEPQSIAMLAQATQGFSGAEIEQAVVAARYTANAQRTPVTLPTLLTEIRATRPLSLLMAEKLAALRGWATTRTVAAG